MLAGIAWTWMTGNHTGVSIYCHMNSDADTVGSALALAEGLESTGSKVEVVIPTLPDKSVLRALPLFDRYYAETPVGYPVAVSVDVASSDRLGEHEVLFENTASQIVIDHHISNTLFGDINWVEETSACAMMIHDLFKYYGVTMTDTMATNLYAGLVTDTGNFRWGNKASFQTAAELVGNNDFSHGDWTRLLMDTHGKEWADLIGYALSHIHYMDNAFDGQGMAVVVIPKEMIKNFDDTRSIVDLIRQVDGYDVSLVMMENESQVYFASLRSKNVNVSEVAVSLGGGGHFHAAGFTYLGSHVPLSFVEKIAASGGSTIQ